MTELQVAANAQIDGDFEGFDDSNIFKLMDGSYWVQDEYKYWYHYSYCPKVQILRGNGRLYLRVASQSEIVAIRQITDVIESKIHGEFKGWDGESKYQLSNGQIWQQSVYKYEYVYAYMPDAVIYNPGSGYVMSVAGTTAQVRRLR